MTSLTSTHKRSNKRNIICTHKSIIFPGFFLACYKEIIVQVRSSFLFIRVLTITITGSTLWRGVPMENNLLARMPGQGRLAISRLRVPNLDAFIDATAGNLCSIGTPRHRVDPVIVIVRTRIIRNEEEKTNKKLTNPSARSAGTRKRKR